LRRDADGEPLPPGAVARQGTLRLFHPGEVNFKAFTPDRRFLITATCWSYTTGYPSADLFFVWDLSTGRLVRQFGHASGGIQHAVQSPDGRQIVSVGPKGTFLWEVPSGRLVRQVEKAREWDASQQKERYAFRDEKTLVALRENWLETLDLTTGRPVGRVRLFELEKGVSPGTSFLSPDGKTLVKVGGHALEVLETSTAKVRGRLRVGPEWFVSFHPGGKVFAVTEREQVTVLSHDAGKARLLRRWQLREKAYYNPLADGPYCRFLPGGNLLATPGPKGAIDLWDWTKGAFVRQLFGWPFMGGQNELTFSLDGKQVACTPFGIGRVRVFDVATGKEILPCEGHHGAVQSIRYTDKHTLVSTGEFGGPSLTWDVRTGRVVRSIPEGRPFDVLSPDGKARAIPNSDGTVLLLDSATGEKRRLLGVTLPRPRPELIMFPLMWLPGPPVVAFSPDGSVLAYADPIGPLRLWSVATGEERGRLRTWHERRIVKSLTFSPDGQLLAVGGREGDGMLEVWDTANAKLLRRVNVPVRGGGKILPPDLFGISAVAFTGNSRGVAAVNSDGPVRLWEISSGRQLLRSDLKDDEDAVCTAVACSPDSRLVAWAEREGAIVMREIASGREVVRFRSTGAREVRALAFSPDSRTLASGGDDVTILLWEVPEPARTPRRGR
jgi:WD40 repeat protein